MATELFFVRLSHRISVANYAANRAITCLPEGQRRALSVRLIRVMVLPSKLGNPNGRAPETWQYLMPRRR